MTPYYADGHTTLYHGDSRLVLPELDPESIDLVFTDPPYDRESMGLYGEAAAVCAPLMKPGAAFVCYAGQYAVGDIINAVAPHLRYWWMLCLWQPGSAARLPGVKVAVMWKPLLLFVKGTRGWAKLIPDGYISPAPDKRHHVWGQSIGPAREIIARLTKPGDTILDPFAGGGTTLRAAKDLGRFAIGVEQKANHCERIVGRLAQQILPLAG